MLPSVIAPLWEIEDTLLALLESVEACEEDLQPELQQQIAEYMSREVAKVDQVAHVIAALEWEQKCAADEMTRLAERKKAAAKAQDRLEAYVCRVMQTRGIKKLAGKTSTLSVRPSDAVVITDTVAVPGRYKGVVATMSCLDWQRVRSVFPDAEIAVAVSLDKAAIKKALKAGEEIPGADLEYRSNLQRK